MHPPFIESVAKHFNNRCFRTYPTPKRQLKKPETTTKAKHSTKNVVQDGKVYLLDEGAGFSYTMTKSFDYATTVDERMLTRPSHTPEGNFKNYLSPIKNVDKSKIKQELYSPDRILPELFSPDSSKYYYSGETTMDSYLSSNTPKRRSFLPKIEEERSTGNLRGREDQYQS